MEFNEFFEDLTQELRPLYAPSQVNSGAHAIDHVERVAKMGPRILGIQGFNGPLIFVPDEFRAAAWLHNIDRTDRFRNQDIPSVCRTFLANSPFSEEAIARIVQVVELHSRWIIRNAGVSDLLTAIQIADMVDRFSATGIVGAGSDRPHFLMYNPNHPFGFGSTKEEDLKTIYGAWPRALEWYPGLPSDEARALIPRRSMIFFITFVRWFAEEMADHLGVPNKAEEDIKKALGPYYEQFRPC